MAVNALDRSRAITAQQQGVQGPGLGYYGQQDIYAQPRSSGQVRGASTGGQVSGGGYTQQSAPSYQNPPMEENPDQPNIDFDSLIAPAIQGLEQAIAPLQQGFADTQGQLEASRGTQIDQTRQSIGAQVQTLDSAKLKQGRMAESAADEARRQYAEIQQGLQSRYGGTTGTGAFAGELAGRDTMRNIGNIREGLSTAIGEIDNKLVQVRELGRIAEQDIADKTSAMIVQARNQLNENISNIRRMQGELQSRKAEMAMSAMQNYQQLVAQVQARNAAFKQQLYVQQQQAEQALAAKRASAQQVAESFSLYNLQQGKQVTPVRIGNKTGTALGLNGQPMDVTGGRLYGTSVGTGLGVEDEEDPDGSAF